MKQKTKQKSILSFLIIVVILSSCSIQKRHYMPGFSVNWNKPIKEISSKKEAAKEVDKNEITVENNEEYVVSASIDIDKNVGVNSDPSLIKERERNQANTIVKNKHNPEKLTPNRQKQHRKLIRVFNKENDKKTEPLSVISFIFLLASIFLIAIGLLLILTTDGSGAGILVVLMGLILGVVSIALLVLALIFGLNALKKINNSNDSKKGKKIAFAAVIGSSFVFLLGIISYIILFIKSKK